MKPQIQNEQALREAIRQWEVSTGTALTPEAREFAGKASKALRLELETGKPHCPCHLLALDKCPEMRR